MPKKHDISIDSPPSGGGRGERGTYRASQADVRRIKEHPVDIRRIVALFAPHKWSLFAVTVIIVASSIISIFQPFIVREIIDSAIPHHDVTLLLKLVGALIAVTIVTQILGVIQTWRASLVGQRVMHTVRSKVYTNLSLQSVNFFTGTKSGEIQSRLINDVSGMQGVLTTTATSIASNATTAIATAVAMVALSPTLSILSLIVIPPAVYLTRKVATTRREITSAQQRALASMQAHISETISVSGMRLSSTLGTREHNVTEFTDLSEQMISLHMHAELAGRWRMATMQIIFAIIPAGVYLIAGLPHTSETISIGTLLAFTTLQTQIFRPMMGLLNVSAQWITSMALFSRIFEYLDLMPDVPESLYPVQLGDVDGHVCIDHVTFSYGDGEKPLLCDLTLDIPAGTSLALVGHTGSGKSTVANLISRLIDPQSGAVTIDGIDLRDISSEDRTRLIGVVSQESYLLHTSIRENLLLARPDATEFDLWAALDAAEAREFIEVLPDGLDTVVGERGYRFSGGEQQRIAIARTILRDPRILILDEATSALDNETERRVQRALDRLSKHRTTLIIAHRLSTVKNADSIAVLDHGSVVEQGSYKELMEQGGVLAMLEQGLAVNEESLAA